MDNKLPKVLGATATFAGLFAAGLGADARLARAEAVLSFDATSVESTLLPMQASAGGCANRGTRCTPTDTIDMYFSVN